MPRVIRCGQKKNKNQKRQWSQAEILRAFWDMEEQITGHPSPLTREVQNMNIPDLKPIPKGVKKDE